MLIAGVRGFAKQVMDVIYQLDLQGNVCFYDDLDPLAQPLYGHALIRTENEARMYFNTRDPRFVLGMGRPMVRQKVAEKLASAGGQMMDLISPLARVARFAHLEPGVTVMTGCLVENDAWIGPGVLLNVQSTVCHDCRIGSFVEISPGAILTGGCEVGDYSFIGAGAVVRPGVKIGSRVVVGAGAAVVEDVPDGTVVAGVPAKPMKV
jgi:sugar O-acyltransferase (sialic acid O-acetyltransferase NeuD family)